MELSVNYGDQPNRSEGVRRTSFRTFSGAGLSSNCMRSTANPLVQEFGSGRVLVVIRQGKLDGDATRPVLWYSGRGHTGEHLDITRRVSRTFLKV